jgi:hypothetical protein
MTLPGPDGVDEDGVALGSGHLGVASRFRHSPRPELRGHGGRFAQGEPVRDERLRVPAVTFFGLTSATNALADRGGVDALRRFSQVPVCHPRGEVAFAGLPRFRYAAELTCH